MSKGKSLKQQWQEAEREAAVSLTQFYVNDEGPKKAERAMSMVVEKWKVVMKNLNPSVGKDFDQLDLDTLAGLEFSPPHPSLPKFAVIVRTAAAVGQKVS